MKAERAIKPDILEQKIGYVFTDKTLPERALTHSSYANEINARAHKIRGGVEHNETLEFLGDSILGFIVTEALYLQKPDENEGKLSRIKAAIVCEASLARCALEMDIGALMKIGSNMPDAQSRRLKSILSDAMEAIFAAVYLDGGIDAAREVITRCLGKSIGEALTQDKSDDSKTRLQEHYFGLDKNVKIVYNVTAENGPAHMRFFTSQVTVNGRVMGAGGGRTKKESEQNAAKEALLNIQRG